MTETRSSAPAHPCGTLTRTIHTGLLTDLYHPDSAYISWRAGMNGLATFDVYARRAPFSGAFMLVAGLETALEFLMNFGYDDTAIAYLQEQRSFDPAFLDMLRKLRFTGDVDALPEGTIAFPHEPFLRITAPYQEALLVESGVLQSVNLATLIATKAARVTYAARGKRVSDFAYRRAQEPFTVSRSARIGGCISTSFLAAAHAYNLRATGTVPHALVELFPTEEGAFQAIADSFDRYTLLLDTYDVRHAIHTAARVAVRTQPRNGHVLTAVRLDGGNLAADTGYVRAVLDGAGLGSVEILVSGDLDEFSIAELEASGAPIDGYGVGTSIGVGAGAEEHGVGGGALGGVYKLVEYRDEHGVSIPKVKVAGAKSTWPGRKQVYRYGVFERDLIALMEEKRDVGSVPLLQPVLRGGRLVAASMPSLEDIYAFARQQREALPEIYRSTKDASAYPVHFSTALRRLRDTSIAQVDLDNSIQR